MRFCNSFFKLICVSAFIMMVASCSTTKRVEDGQYLLVKNKIKFVNPAREISSSDLESLVKPKPNARFLGIFPFKLWINGLFKKGGEPPVLLDLSLLEESTLQMKRYLSNMGFYNSEIEHQIKYTGKKAKKVVYQIMLSEPYRIRNITHSIEDDSIMKIVTSRLDESLIKTGKIFNAFQLDAERNRINDMLKENGYYAFTKDYIFYEADSTGLSRNVDLTLKIRNVQVPGTQFTGEPVFQNHRLYYINKVYIYPDFRIASKGLENYDTLVEPFFRRESKRTDFYHFVYTPPIRVRPDIIGRSMFIETGRKYNSTDASQSFKKLNDFRIYKFVDIQFRETEIKSTSDIERSYLDCYVNLTRNPSHSYSVEFQGTNSGGDLGIAGYLIYQNRNLFRGAEVLNIKLKGALEAQQNANEPEGSNNKFYLFNTSEFGIDAVLQIPRFLAPINEDVFSRYFRPKTAISIGYNAQDRIDYERIVINSTFGYQWSETKFKNHILTPLSASIIKINTTPSFDSLISNESERFKNQYTDHVIVGSGYSYIFNNQEINKLKNFHYFRMNIETGGNLLDGAVKLREQEKNAEGFNTVFGIRYAQFAKIDFDFRYYVSIDKNNSLAFRSFTGLAIPYGNSVDIPFEKGYFGGGSNGMRAWPLRYLGPGSYSESGSGNIERVGDIAIEINSEYRFHMFSVVKGALFYDVGNIWLLNENETFPGGKFESSNFLKELAMDAGIGFRLDFSFFIFRIDFAQKIKDPSRSDGDRLVVGSGKGWFNPVINLGIGYPF